jgi:hypothetical protein
MSKSSLPVEGKCLCGQTRFKVSAPPLVTMACHCTGCQRMSSSAYSLSAAIPAQAFEVTQGTPVIGALHGATQHYYCGHCMSWMFTKPPGGAPFVNVRPTLFDDGRWTKPFVETYTSEKLPWITTPAVHSYATYPELSEYDGLIAAYAAQAETF